jgi:hypothetical protein
MATAYRETSRDLNLVDLLLLEHEQHRTLLTELHGAGGGRGTVLFRRLARMLVVHESAEEVVLYPVVRANFDDGHRLARLAAKQEDGIKKAVAELQSGDLARAHHLSTLASRNKLRALEDMVRAHHDLEEHQIIASLPQVQDAPQLGGLASAYEMVAHLLPTRGHRHAPSRPLGNVLRGTPVAILDKLRDRRKNGADR